MKNIKNMDMEIDENIIKYIKHINDVEIVELRILVNKSLEQKKISRYLDIETLMQVDKFVQSLNNRYSMQLQSIDYKDLYLNVLENGLEY